MKKCYKLFILSALFALFTTVGKAQESLVVEYESSPPPQSIIAILIGLFTPDDFDYNGDGKREIIVRVGPELRIINSLDLDSLLWDWVFYPGPGMTLDDYRCLGFHDVGGGIDKELILVPKPGAMGDVIACSLNPDNQFIPSFSWGALQGGGWFFGVENTDGDAQSEILAAMPGEQFYVLGQGFTPGLTGDDPSEKFKGEKPSEKVLGLDFQLQYVAPPNFRWPGNYTYVEPGSQDFNFDNINDYGFIKFDGVDGESIVVSGGSHDTLSKIPISFSLNFEEIKQSFFDVTGEGYKYIMIGGSNSGSGLTDMEIILWLNPQTNELNTSLMPFLEAGFRVVAIGNPFGMGGTPTTGIIMRHMTTGRVIVVGDGPGFQGGGTGNFTLPSGPEGGSSVAYTLNLVYESQVPVTLFMPFKEAFGGAELDANGDGTVDLPYLVLQDSVGNDLAGFSVLDGVTHQPVWETTVPAGGSIDPAPFFHGFFDANGDGVKEIIFGAETVQTHDSEIHKPFGAGFQIRYIYDIDGDGFEEIIGETPEGKIQVWSSHSFVSGTFERQLQDLLGLSVFPNPSHGGFVLKLSQPISGSVTLDIFDSKGALVQDMKLNLSNETSLELELEDQLPSGQYFLRVCSENGCSTEKIIIER